MFADGYENFSRPEHIVIFLIQPGVDEYEKRLAPSMTLTVSGYWWNEWGRLNNFFPLWTQTTFHKTDKDLLAAVVNLKGIFWPLQWCTEKYLTTCTWHTWIRFYMGSWRKWSWAKVHLASGVINFRIDFRYSFRVTVYFGGSGWVCSSRQFSSALFKSFGKTISQLAEVEYSTLI